MRIDRFVITADATRTINGGESTTSILKNMTGVGPAGPTFVSGCPTCGVEDYKVRTRSRYAETTCTNDHQYYYCPVCQVSTPGMKKKVPYVMNGQEYMVDAVDEKGCCCPKTITAMYEDKPRKQPRDISSFNEGNRPPQPDILVKVRRENPRSDFEKYKGSKGKGTIVSPAFDKGNYNVKKSEILLCSDTELRRVE